MTARIKIDQVGLPAGVAGRARTDGLADGSLVTLTDVEGTGLSTFHLLWGPPADTTARPSLAATVDPNVWTFSPTAGLHDTFLIELRVSGSPVERRIFGIRTASNHLLVPALNERASRHANWDNDGADQAELSENNALDFADPDLNAYPYAGWWRSLRELYEVVEAGTGGIADHSIALVKLVQGPALSLMGNPTNLPGDAVYIPSSAGFQYIRSNAANTALEWADLGDFASASIVFGANEFERAALTGAIAAAQNSNATFFAGIRDNGSAENDRSNLNFLNSTSVALAVADDAGGDELEITAQRAALTGAIVAALNSNATLFGGIRDNGAAENDRTNLNFLSSTSVTIAVTDDSGNDELEIVAQRAALTGDITAAANSNVTAFGSAVARSVLAVVGNAAAVPAFSQAPGSLLRLRSNEANTGLEWAAGVSAVQLTAASLTNNASALAMTDTLTIPANTLAAGHKYRCSFAYRFVRGATPTALNLNSFFDIGIGVSTINTAFSAQTAAGTYEVRVEAEFTVLTTGVGGTAMAWLSTYGTAYTATGGVATVSNLAVAINTTTAITLRGAAQMNTAVSNTSITALGGHIERLN